MQNCRFNGFLLYYLRKAQILTTLFDRAILFSHCLGNFTLSAFPLHVNMNRVCSRRPCWRSQTINHICIRIKFISQRKIILLFRSSNMAAVNILYCAYTLCRGAGCYNRGSILLLEHGNLLWCVIWIARLGDNPLINPD